MRSIRALSSLVKSKATVKTPVNKNTTVSATFGMRIAVVNLDNLNALEVASTLRAINTQLSRDVFPAWNIAASVATATTGSGYQGVVYLQRTLDVEGALGYHWRTAAGVPYALVSPEISAQYGEPWSVTLSHEVLEMVIDPLANQYAVGPHPTDHTRDVFWWFEACDAVESDKYSIDSIHVSNFVLPLYFTPEAESGKANDYLGTNLRSFGLRPGGYAGYFDPTDGNEYNVFADSEARARYDARHALGDARRSKGRFKKPTNL